jgi:hypothetical protein
MTQTRISQALIMLGGEPQDIVLDSHAGHLTVGLGSAAAISLDDASPAVLLRLATVFADAAAIRARQLQAVAA